MTNVNRKRRPSALLAVLALVLAMAANAAAQTNYCNNPVAPCDPNDSTSACYRPPDPSPRCEPCDGCTGSPCHVGSGVYTADAVDLEVRTLGFPITVSRLYESSHRIDGDLGYGWVSGLSAGLRLTRYRKSPLTPGSAFEAHVRLPDGRLYRFTQNSDTTFSPPSGRFDRLVQNYDGTWDFFPQRTRSRFRFAEPAGLLEAIDDFGNRVTWEYEHDRLIRIQQAVPEGSGTAPLRYLDITWGADGRISDVTDHAGRTVHYDYNEDGTLERVTNPLKQSTTYGYVAGKYGPLLHTVTDHWNRLVTSITYDNRDRVKTYTDRGELYTYQYAYNGNPAAVAKSDSLGNTWTYLVAADGLVTTRTAPGTAPQQTAYDGSGLFLSHTDEVGVRTTATYNARGNPLTLTLDAGQPPAVRFLYGYDENFPDLVTSVTPVNPVTGQMDPHWQGAKWDYHPPGSAAPGALHRTYEVDDDGVTTRVSATYTYLPNGRLESVTDANGGVTTYTYDAIGNVASITRPANNGAGTRPVTAYLYDSTDHVQTVTDPAGQVTRFTWDVLGRMTSVTLPKPSVSSALNFRTTYVYDELDAESLLVFTQIVDASGRTTRFGFDQHGRMTQRIGHAGDKVRNEYAGRRLAAQYDANNNRTTYEYDGRERLSKVNYPDGTFESYAYYGDSTVQSHRDRAGQTMSFTYDALKRMKTKQYPDGRSVTLTFLGQKLQTIADVSGASSETHSFAWNPSFRLEATTQAGRGTLSFTYGTDGLLRTRTVGGGGPTTTLDYYPDGALRSIEWSPVSGLFEYEYSLDGRLRTLAFPNGQTREYGYDDQGRITQLANRDAGGADLAAFSYAYDVDPFTGGANLLGRRTGVTSTIPMLGLASATTRFSYDEHLFLARAAYPSPYQSRSAEWTYDGEGNRQTETIGAVTATYAYEHLAGNPLNGRRLLSDGANAYGYDPKGNVTARTGSRGSYSLTYDHDNLLRTVSGDAGASFGYDYAGRRTFAQVSGPGASFLYDGVHAIQEIAGASRTEYLFGPGFDQPLAMLRDGAVYYYAVDALGSVAAVSNSAGAAQNAYAWDAWGNALAATENVPNTLGFTAREASVAGLQYFRFRHYEPATGRFAGEDPVGFVGGLNPYLYSLADPVLYNDPLGLWVKVCLYPDGAGGLGHVGFNVDDPPSPTFVGPPKPTYGFFPSGFPGQSPGQVVPDNKYPRQVCVWLPTSGPQDDCMTRCLERRRANPGTYNLLTNNCTDFVRSCLAECGIPNGPHNGPSPFFFFFGLVGR